MPRSACTRRTVLRASLAATAALAAPRLSRAAPPRVAFVNPGWSNEDFWRSVTAVAQAAAEQLGFALDVAYAERNPLRMKELGREAAASRPDYLMIVNEVRTAGFVLEEAERLSVRTFLLNNAFIGEDLERYGQPRAKFASYIGALLPDNESAGHLMGKRLIAAVRAAGLAAGGTVTLAAISGILTTPAAAERADGLKRAIDEDGKAELVHHVAVNWTREEGADRASAILRRHPQVNAIWCANDPIALGAIDSAVAAGRKPGRDIFLSGLNWAPAALEAVRDGRLELSVGGHFMAGGFALVLLRDHMDGKDFAVAVGGARQAMPFASLDRNNIDAYTARFGARDWRAIGFARFRRGDSLRYDFSPTRILES
ncbi:MAG: ABC transporter substrate-binding protein [Alphaproteobacteria bacterium]|nr:ABC transporter substrate-binding protein [Alphaproteobacteria bacterium]